MKCGQIQCKHDQQFRYSFIYSCVEKTGEGDSFVLILTGDLMCKFMGGPVNIERERYHLIAVK